MRLLVLKPRPMKVTNEPALGIVWENSDIVFPVARIATPATRNAHGAWEPMATTTRVIDRKMPSTGARLASVEDSVSNKVSAPRASRGGASVPRGSSMVAMTTPIVSCRCARVSAAAIGQGNSGPHKSTSCLWVVTQPRLSGVRREGLITVEDLLRSPALQLRLLAGESGTGRRVAWAHVSELEDPTPWLFGSEMIMTTGMALPRSAAGQRSYLERLDDAGVACLAVSERMFAPPLTASFLAAAASRGFPVVEVPIPVPFMAISQEVAAAVVMGGAGQRLNAQLQIFGAVRWLAAGNVSAAEIFARLERLSGYSLYACTLGRTRLLDGLRVPPPEYADLIPATVTSPPTVPGGYVLPVTGPRGTAGYILAMESPSAAPAGVSVVQHIATVAALQLSMLAHEREILRRSGAETLAEMLQGQLEGSVVTRRLAGNGFAVDRPLRLAVVPGAADDDRVADALASAALPYLILRQQDELVVLVQDGEADRAALTGALARGGRVQQAVRGRVLGGGGPA